MPAPDHTEDRLAREAARDASLKKKRQKRLAQVMRREERRLQVDAAHRTAIERRLGIMIKASTRRAAQHDELVARLDID